MGDDGHRSVTVVVASARDAAGEVLARVVESAGHRVVRPDEPTVDAVLRVVTSEPAAVVVVDLGRDSQPTLRSLAARPPTSRPRLVAVAEGPGGAEAALAAGAVVALTRPFHARDLVAALDAGPTATTTAAATGEAAGTTGATEGEVGAAGVADDAAPAADPEPTAEPEPEPAGDPLLELRRRR